MSIFQVELVRADIKNDNHIMIRGYFENDNPTPEKLSVCIDGKEQETVFKRNNLNEIRRDYSMHGKDVYEEYYTSVDARKALGEVESLDVFCDGIKCFDLSGKKLNKILMASQCQVDAAEIKDNKTYIYGRAPHFYDIEVAVTDSVDYKIVFSDDARIAALYQELDNSRDCFFEIEISSDNPKAVYNIQITEKNADGVIRQTKMLKADIYALATAVLYGQKYGMVERFKRYSRRYGLPAAIGHYAKRFAVHVAPDYTYNDFRRKYDFTANTTDEQGDYVVFTAEGMNLTQDSIYYFNNAFEAGADIAYADEDEINSTGEYTNPRFKTGFSLEYLYNTNYIGFPVAVRRALLTDLGIEIKSVVDDYRDWYDALLTLCENAKSVVHIQKVLGHGKGREYVFSDKEIVSRHLNNRGVCAKISEGYTPLSSHIQYAVKGNPLISVIIPNKDNVDVLKRCVDSLIEKSAYRNFEIIIVENNSTDDKTFDYYKSIDGQNNIRVLYYPDGFNFSAINNYGVREAKGEYLLLLNNDTELLQENSLAEMLGICQCDGVGICGSLLYFPDDTIQHAGVAIGLQGLANHEFSGESDIQKTYLGEAAFSHDMSAVTAACLMISRKLFDELNGFDERLTVAFNDVDLCLRVKEMGLKIIYTPYSVFYHYESKSRGHEDSVKKQRREEGEVQLCGLKHEEYLAKLDPFYNKNLTRIYMNASLRR